VPHTPETMMILMQKDVWDKVLWCGKNKSSVIRLFVQKKYHPEEILTVQKESFIPPPKVESSILFFKKHDLYNFIDDDIFLKLIKIWFSANRKKLFKNFISWGLSKNIVQDIFDKNQINQNVRAEDLSIDIWSKIISDFISFWKL
jgi:16S rRNA A1518/A1519 N6-dimethyltransferase RsmA/KsgA/DIM1 with predicted DNA glycosylase/AP lyase activity